MPPFLSLKVRKRGYTRRIKLKCIVSNTKKSKNVPVYAIEKNMDCFQLAVSADFREETQTYETMTPTPSQSNQIWNFFLMGHT